MTTCLRSHLSLVGTCQHKHQQFPAMQVSVCSTDAAMFPKKAQGARHRLSGLRLGWHADRLVIGLSALRVGWRGQVGCVSSF